MKVNEMHKILVDSVDQIVSARVSSMTTTNSIIGVVSENPDGFNCKVKIKMDEVTCIIPEHLHSWIQKDDIVIIQDLYNDGQKRMITGKTGQLQSSPSLVFYDKDEDKNTSGVDGLFDKEDNLTGLLGTVVSK